MFDNLWCVVCSLKKNKAEQESNSKNQERTFVMKMWENLSPVHDFRSLKVSDPKIGQQPQCCSPRFDVDFF